MSARRFATTDGSCRSNPAGCFPEPEATSFRTPVDTDTPHVRRRGPSAARDPTSPDSAMSATTPSFLKPEVRVAEADYDRLANLSHARDSEAALLLEAELERSRIVDEAQLAAEPRFVRLGSWVEYRDLLSGRSRKVQVTTPERADIDVGRLSVLSPVGAALIGLSADDTFSWTAEGGRPRMLRVRWVGEPGSHLGPMSESANTIIEERS
jgi:regulator of nucleoside diphosphate kinase